MTAEPNGRDVLERVGRRIKVVRSDFLPNPSEHFADPLAKRLNK
jgi:hypothetical protein